MHEDRPVRDAAVAEDRSVRRYAWNAQASADLIAHPVGELDGLSSRNDGQLRRGAEGPVGLSPEDPHPLPHPNGVDPLADRLDHAGSIAVGDHPGKRHLRPQPAATFLGVAGVDRRQSDPHTNLALTGFGRRHLSDLEDLVRTPCRSYQTARTGPCPPRRGTAQPSRQ